MRPLRDAASYALELLAHLPKGAVWPTALGDPRTPIWTGLLTALGQEPARVDLKVRAMLKELDPRTAEDMYSDWLYAYGQPDPCLAAPVSAAVQRQRLVDLVTMKGSLTPKFLEAIAWNLGYDVFVEKFQPLMMGFMTFGPEWLPHTTFADTRAAFALQIHSPSVEVQYFYMGSSSMGDSLGAFGNDPMECVLRKHVRATLLPRLTFAYADPQSTFGPAALWQMPGPGNGAGTAMPARAAGATYCLVGTFAAEAFVGSDAAYALIASSARISVGAAAGGDAPRVTVPIAPQGLALVTIVQRDENERRSIDVRVNGADVGSASGAGAGAIAGDMIAWTNGGLQLAGLKQWPLDAHELDWLERCVARQFNIPLAGWPVDLRQGDV